MRPSCALTLGVLEVDDAVVVLVHVYLQGKGKSVTQRAG